jgi:cytochrome c-type protein NapC
MARKAKASLELIDKPLGTIDTREQFEAHRLELAKMVWETMKSTDSRECKDCHAFEYMDLNMQDASAQKKHTLEYIKEAGKTCIDCHNGLAHHLPKATGE